MSDTDTSALVTVGAVDVDTKTLGHRRFEVATGIRRFVLAAQDSEWESLHRAITEIVPKLCRSAPIREQLTADETRRLLPHVRQLSSMGVLLHPRVPIDSDADLRLYSFVARRSPSPDEVYATVKRKAVHVSGPGPAVAVLTDVMVAQGLRVPAEGPSPALAVVVSFGDGAELALANERLCGQGTPSVPVLITARRARIGPWTVPGESACLHCVSTMDPEDSAVSTGSWRTAQAGFLYWIAGVVTHLALAAFVGMGVEHPWGQITTIDAGTGEQSAVRAWRDPYCGVCASRAPAAQEWVEM